MRDDMNKTGVTSRGSSRSAVQGAPGIVARWVLPSIGSFSILLTAYLLVMNGWRFLLDSDTGWHIRTGEMILGSGVIPRTDPFSHTLPGRPWFAWEWLADVLMALAHQWQGLAGVVGGALLVLTIAYGLLYLEMARRGADPLISSVMTLLAAICCIVHWLARPHLFSILLMVVWLALIESYRRRRSRMIWLVPPLITLWANLHGAFAVTFAVLFIYILGEVIEALVEGNWRLGAIVPLRRVLLTYAGVGLASAAAALVTPFGLGLYRHIWRYLNDKELLSTIQEFQSPDFHLVDGKLVEILLFLGAVAVIIALRRGKVIEAGLFLLWAHLTLQSERHVTLAAVTLAPIISEQLTYGIGRIVSCFEGRDSALAGAGGKESSSRRFVLAIVDWYRGILRIDRQVTGAAVYLAVLLAIIGLTVSPWADKLLSPRFSPGRFPVAASDYILSQLPAGKGYSHDQFGGYLIYRLYPQYKVFVDGRSDFYRQGTVLQDMEKVSLVKPEWATKLDQYEIQWMLLRRDEPLVLISLMSGRWRTIYQDGVAQILVRTGQ
jgi:hypothetical protein